MPHAQQHRGQAPPDARLFCAAALPDLRSAVADLSWLLSRDYGPDAALKTVGDRYRLTARQRKAVRRAACSDAAREDRSRRRVVEAAYRGAILGVDGFNVLITVESALSGGAVFVGRDGAYRDLAGVHGTYRRVDETVPALRHVIESIEAMGVAEVHWLLDQPVSNSGRLKALACELLDEYPAGPPWRIELARSPDRLLAAHSGVVATSDSAILDACRHWINLPQIVIERNIPNAWLIDLGGE